MRRSSRETAPTRSTCTGSPTSRTSRASLTRADDLLRQMPASPEVGGWIPPRIDRDELHAEIGRAVARLPEAFRRALDCVQILVEPYPPRDQVVMPRPSLLGRFLGFNDLVPDRRRAPSPTGLPRIVLYHRNLELAVADRAGLADEIATTLYHELAHKLGFDEDGVAKLGLE